MPTTSPKGFIYEPKVFTIRANLSTNTNPASYEQYKQIMNFNLDLYKWAISLKTLKESQKELNV